MKRNQKTTQISLEAAKKTKGKSNWSKLFGEQKKEKAKVVKVK